MDLVCVVVCVGSVVWVVVDVCCWLYGVRFWFNCIVVG